jgi:Bacterial Ig-like domain (group 1)
MVKETVKVTRASLAVLTAFGAMVAVGCNDNNANLAALVATFITANAGSSGQTGVAGQALPNPISVHVTDQNNNSFIGAVVSWSVVGAGGSVSSATSITDANGNATVNWTLGTAVGVDSLVASIPIGASVTITATATAAVTALLKVSGDNQTVVAGTTSQPLVVRVANANGTGISGATVTWVVANGGTLSANSTLTDANGDAQVTLATSAVPGTATVTATGPSGAQQTFSVTGQ